MSGAPLRTSKTTARRLAVSKQRLAGRLPSSPGPDAILSVVRDLAYVQWDPIAIVAPSHIISLWNRLGNFRPSDLEKLLWEEKRLFEHWLPFAAIVLTEDYPIFSSLMQRYPESLGKSWGSQRASAKRFLARRSELRRKMLQRLRSGPLVPSEFEDHLRTRRHDGDWTPGSDVEHMLFHLHMAGDVMVVGHRRNQNLWGLTGEFLPDWVERSALSEPEFEREAAQRAICALGTANTSEIHYYFVRGRYEHLREALAELQQESVIHRVHVDGLGARDERYVHRRDLALLESLQGDHFQPRLSLLPPFDNLICSTARTRRLFDFQYVREQFLPPEKRRFGLYVLPILWGETLIGRIDARLDKAGGKLVVHSVYAEPDAPGDREVSDQIGETIARFAEFLGAREVTYGSNVPALWKSSLR
jgi:uncharacterized protein YcaQ